MAVGTFPWMVSGLQSATIARDMHPRTTLQRQHGMQGRPNPLHCLSLCMRCEAFVAPGFQSLS